MESHQLDWCTQWTALVKYVTSKNIQQSFSLMSDFYSTIFLKMLMILFEVCSEDFMSGIGYTVEIHKSTVRGVKQQTSGYWE